MGSDYSNTGFTVSIFVILQIADRGFTKVNTCNIDYKQRFFFLLA